MAIVSRLQLNHPTLGTAGGAGLHASIESLYTKIGDNMADRWFAIADFDQTEVVDLLHNFETDINNLRYDLYNFTGGEWVRLTAATSPARSAFSVIEKVGSEATTLQITNNTGGNNLTFAVGITFDSISLADSDIKDVDIVTTSPEDGQSLVWDSVSSKFKPGASGDSSFKLQGVTDPNVTIKGGYLLLDDGREIATYAGSGTAATDFGTDIVVNLDTVLGSNPVNATTYYLYLNLLALGSEVTIDNGRKVYSVAAADTSKFYLSTTKPEAIKKSQYSVIGFIKSATTGTVWSGSGSAFGTIASKKFNQRKVESYNYLFDFYTAQSLGTVGNGNVSDTGNRSLSTLEEWQSTNTTNISLSASSSSPLRSPFNFLFTGSGNNATGTTFIESPAFQLHVVDLGNPVMVSFDLADVTADGNFDVCMVRYNSSGTYQEKISIAGNASGATPASAKLPLGTTKFNGFFISSSTSTDYYALRIRRLAGTDVPRMDSLKISPDSVVQGAAIATEYASNNGTWDATDTTSFVYDSDGSAMGGSLTADRTKRVRFINAILPTDKLTLEIKLNSSGDDNWFEAEQLGVPLLLFPTVPTGVGIVNQIGSTDLDVIFKQYAAPGTTYNSGTGASNWSTGSWARWRVKKQSVTTATTLANRAVEEYASNNSTTDADDTTNFAYGIGGSTTPGTLTTSRIKRIRFKSPIQPTDLILLEIAPSATGPWRPGNALNYVNGVWIDAYGANNTGWGDLRYVSNTDMDVVFNRYRTVTTNWATTDAYWRVRKVSGGASVGFQVSARNVVGDVSGTAVPSGYIGETIECKSGGTTKNLSNNVYVTFSDNTNGGVAGGVVLTPGKWSLTFVAVIEGNNSANYYTCAISTASGNNLPGISGETFIDIQHQAPVSGIIQTVCIANYIVNISSTTNYYGVINASNNVTPNTSRGRLTAIRIA